MKTQQHILFRQTIATCTVSLLALPGLGNAIMPSAVWASPIAAQIGSMAFTPPPPPPDRDAPGHRGGGAGRGCGAGNQSLMALAPEYQQTLGRGAITKVWGTTVAERPTFWFDVPYENGAIVAMEFVLQDNSRPAKDLYRSAIVPPATPGIVNLRLPTAVPPLETGKLYQWFFKVRLQCGSRPTSGKPQSQKEELYGWVQRVSPSASLTNQLKQATPQQQATLYSQNGIWFDALTTLGELRLSKPQDAGLTADWNRLLQSIGLEKLTKKPLIPCCNPKS